MQRYDIDQTCDFCSMSKANDGAYVDYAAVQACLSQLIEHLWESSPSIDLRDKAKLDAEVRAFFD